MSAGNLDNVGEVYRAAWCPRTDAYADWSIQGEHWYAVREELTVPRILDGLRKVRPPVSAYMDDREGNTHVLAVDFDRDDGWDLGLRLARIIDADGGHAYVERSRRGCHVWATSEVLPGDTVRRALRYWLGRVDPAAARDPKCEIMPMAVQRGPDTVGHSLRLPMMPHQRTGQRFPLCDSDGKPLGHTLGETMMAVWDTPAEVVRAAAKRGPLEPLAAPPMALRYPLGRPKREAGDVVALLQAAGAARAAPGRTIRCVLHDDKQASMSISRDSERVWCHSPSCEAYNNGHGLGAEQLAKALQVGSDVHG